LFTLEYITVHETAHQWWYGIVGSNQVGEAWLDEGLTEYSTILYFEKKYGPDTAKGLFENLIKKRYDGYVAAAEEGPGANIQGTLEEYRDSEQYHTLVYCGGALIFQNLRDIMGDEKFFRVLEVYYRNYAFQNATAEDFIRIIENMGDNSLGERIREWLVMGF
jgi:aminopeptidase N